MLGPSAAVIGVGLNVLDGERLSRQVGQPVTDVQRHIGPVDRNGLLLELVPALLEGLDRFDQGGFAAFHAEWQACHAHQQRRVSLQASPEHAVVGRALGVDEQGALLLETETGVRRFHAGEVSLRPEAA